MTGAENPEGSTLERLVQRLHSLEQRVAGIENQLSAGNQAVKNADLNAGRAASGDQTSDDLVIHVDEGAIESKIGEYGLAWLGSIVLLFGIAFFITYIHGLGYIFLSAILGYGSVAGVFIASYYVRKSLPHLVFMLDVTGFLLAFYTTLRLYFFTTHPLISSKGVVIALLLLAIAIQCYYAVRKKSELLAGIALTLALVTAVISDTVHVTMPVIAVTATTALFFFIRYSWWRLLIVSLFLVYLSHGLWLINNPFLGHPAGFLPAHPYSTIYLFACGIIFSAAAWVRNLKTSPQNIINTLVLINGICFSLVIFPVTVTYFRDHYVWLYAIISAFCLIYSAILKMRKAGLFPLSLFACFGFMALSVAVYGFAGLPDSYFYLSMQSFLVVSMALWYRSRIIVVMNTFLYIGILLIYLSSSPSVDRISFSFAIVAFLTARILNWKKERLTLKTDLMRNFYLAALFFTMLYAMYHVVPSRYVTLSWTAVAAGYFILSMILRNIKYRWMALGTLLVTGVYLFGVDLANLEVGYRVIAFLFLACISIAASVYYTKKIRKKRNQEKMEE